MGISYPKIYYSMSGRHGMIARTRVMAGLASPVDSMELIKIIVTYGSSLKVETY